ncbi:MAG: hypothetical protein J7578_22585 [Chitinophagaceae bacterium]|nr:hypothetical protein [Chitinophagaceae bacterium]
MKFTSVLLAAIILLSACSNKVIPVKNEYTAIPVQYKINQNTSLALEKLLDFGIKNGYAIKLLDKNSGLIVFDNVNMPATWERKDTGLVHPDAYLVLPKWKKISTRTEIPVAEQSGYGTAPQKIRQLRGEWNIRISNTESGVMVYATLVQVKYISMNKKSTKSRELIGFRSTGNFERLIAKQLQ